MKAYNGSQEQKSDVIARMTTMIKTKRLIQGLPWDGERGCFLSCLGDSYDVIYASGELGINRELLLLIDVMFDGLPEDGYNDYVMQFLEALKPGADTSLVASKLTFWAMTCSEFKVYSQVPSSQKLLLSEIINVLRNRVDFKETDPIVLSEIGRDLNKYKEQVNASEDQLDQLIHTALWSAINNNLRQCLTCVASIVASPGGIFNYTRQAIAYRQMANELIRLLSAAPVS